MKIKLRNISQFYKHWGPQRLGLLTAHLRHAISEAQDLADDDSYKELSEAAIMLDVLEHDLLAIMPEPAKVPVGLQFSDVGCTDS